MAGGCVQHLLASFTVSAACSSLRGAEHRCVRCPWKPLHGTGSAAGPGLHPLRCPLPVPEQREGELTPLLFILHSTADLDFPCELDSNSPSNFNPRTKSALREVGHGTSDYFTLTMCRKRVSVDGLTPLTGYLPSMLPRGLQTLPVGRFFVPAGSLSAMQPKLSSAPDCAAN